MSDESNIGWRGAEDGLRDYEREMYDPEAGLSLEVPDPKEFARSIIDLAFDTSRRTQTEREALISVRIRKIAERYGKEIVAQVIQQLESRAEGTIGSRLSDDAAAKTVANGLRQFAEEWIWETGKGEK